MYAFLQFESSKSGPKNWFARVRYFVRIPHKVFFGPILAKKLFGAFWDCHWPPVVKSTIPFACWQLTLRLDRGKRVTISFHCFYYHSELRNFSKYIKQANILSNRGEDILPRKKNEQIRCGLNINLAGVVKNKNENHSVSQPAKVLSKFQY